MRCWSIALALLGLMAARAQATEHRELWFFTADEIGTAYRYQMNFGERIPYPIGGQECTLGQEKFLASDRKSEFWLSCRFIKQTVRHLTEMLDAGAARYLFSLDADHAHLAVPKTLWEQKYRDLPFAEILPAILEDPSTIALYHTAEHLAVIDPISGKPDPEAKAWKDKRNVIGYFDGRPIKIRAPDPSGAGLGAPDGYVSFGGFRFLAGPNGLLQIFRRKEAITFDITLDFGESADVAFPAGPGVNRLATRDKKNPVCTAIE
jgi:hypothetical protein